MVTSLSEWFLDICRPFKVTVYLLTVSCVCLQWPRHFQLVYACHCQWVHVDCTLIAVRCWLPPSRSHSVSSVVCDGHILPLVSMRFHTHYCEFVLGDCPLAHFCALLVANKIAPLKGDLGIMLTLLSSVHVSNSGAFCDCYLNVSGVHVDCHSLLTFLSFGHVTLSTNVVSLQLALLPHCQWCPCQLLILLPAARSL